MVHDDLRWFFCNNIGCISTVQIIGYVHSSAHIQSPPLILDSRVIEVILMASPIADVTVKTAMRRRIFLLEMTQMPFADTMVYVTAINVK